MEILNHLEDLSDYGIEYTEEDKRIFLEFENEIKTAGYDIKYMNAPVDIIENNTITAMCIRVDDEILSGIDLFNNIINNLIKDNSQYNFIIDNKLFIYTMAKIKIIRDDIPSFVYTFRIGSTKI